MSRKDLSLPVFAMLWRLPTCAGARRDGSSRHRANAHGLGEHALRLLASYGG